MRITRYLWQTSPTLTLLSAVLGFTSGVCSALLIAFINSTLSKAPSGRVQLAAAFFGLCFLNLVAGCLSQMALMWLSVHVANTMRIRLCAKIAAAPLAQLEEMGTHGLNANLTEDIGSLTSGLSQLPVFYMQLGVVLVCILYLAWLSVPLMALVMVFVVAAIFSYRIPASRGEKYFEKAREKWDRLSYYLISLLHGIKELKLDRDRREYFFKEELEPAAAELRKGVAMGAGVFTIADTWGRLLVFLLIGLLVFFSGAAKLSTPLLTSFVVTILYMSGFIQGIVGMMPNLVRCQVALKKLEDLGFSFEEEKLRARAEVDRDWRSIELDNVGHTYYREGSPENFILGPINLSIEPGKIIFITGANGSGKTTFAKILTGLYKPQHGMIRFNGSPVSEETIEHYRQHFSAIFSDFYVFDHLGFAKGRISDETVARYLERLNLHHCVQIRNGKLSTTSVSAGQKKRLALLSVLLQDHPIFLFDEWAADQDRHFKQVFYDELLPELKQQGATAIVITHDYNFHTRADRIIEFRDGQIIADSRFAQGGEERALGPQQTAANASFLTGPIHS